MRYTGAASQLLTAATLGYVGASPFNSVTVSWACAVAASVGTLAWRRWISHSAPACALASPVAADEIEERAESTRHECVS